MKQVTITQIKYIKDYILEIKFSDNCIKQFNFDKLIQFVGIAQQLKNIDLFKQVQIIQNGRAFGWSNNYDCCADWVRYYAKDLQDEWKDFDDNTTLNQRIKISQIKLKQVEDFAIK